MRKATCPITLLITMISFFRHSSLSLRRVALGIALVLLFFGIVGEALHARQHQNTAVIGAETLAAQIAPARAIADNCPMCEWENVLLSSLNAVVLPLLLLCAAAYTHLTQQCVFCVRQTIALRESRGPPRLA